jgi:hypothetical protein
MIITGWVIASLLMVTGWGLQIAYEVGAEDAKEWSRRNWDAGHPEYNEVLKKMTGRYCYDGKCYYDNREEAWDMTQDRPSTEWGTPGLKWGGIACCLVAVLLMCLSAKLAPKPEPEEAKMTVTIVTADQNGNSSVADPAQGGLQQAGHCQQGDQNAGQTQPLM